MSNKVYDVLVIIAQIVLPAVVVLILTLGEIWHIPMYVEIAATVTAIDAFMGAILKGLSVQYQKKIKA